MQGTSKQSARPHDDLGLDLSEAVASDGSGEAEVGGLEVEEGEGLLGEEEELLETEEVGLLGLEGEVLGLLADGGEVLEEEAEMGDAREGASEAVAAQLGVVVVRRDELGEVRE